MPKTGRNQSSQRSVDSAECQAIASARSASIADELHRQVATIIRFVILLTLLGVGVVSASAHSCKDRRVSLDVFLQELVRSSDIVAFGSVVRHGDSWRAQIDRVWKGEVPPEVVLTEYLKPHRDSGPDFIFANGPQADGRYVGAQCAAFLRKADTV